MPANAGLFLLWHVRVVRSARTLPEPNNLTAIGWVSALARGNARHVRAAQAAQVAAEKQR